MLQNLKPEEVLFLDIETVSAHRTIKELSAYEQSLWEEKSRFTRERKQLSLDESYLEAGIHAEFGKIICISVGFFKSQKGSREFRTHSFFGHDEAKLLNEFADLLKKHGRKSFRLLCAHNGKEFDFPYIGRRMLINGIVLPDMLDLAGKKPWETPHLDTMELWKFGDYKHYTSLKLLAHIFGIPTPKDDIDGSQVHDVYYENNDLNRIEVYCRKDVVTVAQLFLAFRGEPLLVQEELLMETA
ncbi:MAG: 3'-5' exonuclease [Flavobacteriales bacterium]|nr:3'-5' exonuclease [Flavobacteriales bacterium]